MGQTPKVPNITATKQNIVRLCNQRRYSIDTKKFNEMSATKIVELAKDLNVDIVWRDVNAV